MVTLGLVIAAALFWKLRIIDPASALPSYNPDLWTQIYPMWYRASRSMAAGSVPLWNPFQVCGTPFLATGQYGVLYPLNFPLLLFPTQVAMELITVEHIFAAGWFMYLYARGVRSTRPGAAAAGITFMWSGFVSSWALAFIPALEAAVWLPLALLAIEEIFTRRRFAWAAVLATAVAMPILCGHLQTWTYSMYAIGAYAAARLAIVGMRREQRIHLPVVCVLGGVALVLGLSLAAVQILPTLEMQRLTQRAAGGLSMAQMFPYGSTPPAKLLADAVASTPGFSRQMYIGSAALILIPLSLLADRGRLRLLYLWCLALGAIGLALTVYTPLFGFYLMVPSSHWFRIPERIVFLYAFAGAALTGVAVDVLMRLPNAAARGRRLAGLVIVTLAGSVWVLGVPMTTVTRVYMVIGVACVWGALCFRRRALHGALVFGLIGLLAWDLFCATSNETIRPYHRLDLFNVEREVLDIIKQRQGAYRTYFHIDWRLPQLTPKQGTLAEIYSITDYEPLSLSRFGNFFRLLQPVGTVTASSGPFIGFLDLKPVAARMRLFDLMSVRYIVTAEREPPFQQALAAAGWQPILRTAQSHIVYENPVTLPRAYVAHAALYASDETAALQTITQPSFDPRRNVVLEAAPPAEAPAVDATMPGITEARIVSYGSERVVIRSDDPRAGSLVLTDTFYPGWKADVDGEVQRIARANSVFRAVPVPPGGHTVTFSYEPLSFRIGAWISLAALCCLVGGLAWDRYRSRAHR